MRPSAEKPDPTAAELARMHRAITQSVVLVCSVIGLIVWLMLSQTTSVREELEVTRDSVLESLQEAKDSGAVQRARLKYRLDSLTLRSLKRAPTR